MQEKHSPQVEEIRRRRAVHGEHLELTSWDYHVVRLERLFVQGGRKKGPNPRNDETTNRRTGEPPISARQQNQ